jgi:hypothetical protein
MSTALSGAKKNIRRGTYRHPNLRRCYDPVSGNAGSTKPSALPIIREGLLRGVNDPSLSTCENRLESRF